MQCDRLETRHGRRLTEQHEHVTAPLGTHIWPVGGWEGRREIAQWICALALRTEIIERMQSSTWHSRSTARGFFCRPRPGVLLQTHRPHDYQKLSHIWDIPDVFVFAVMDRGFTLNTRRNEKAEATGRARCK